MMLPSTQLHKPETWMSLLNLKFYHSLPPKIKFFQFYQLLLKFSHFSPYLLVTL